MPEGLENRIVGTIPPSDTWDDPHALSNTSSLQIGIYGPEYTVVEGLAQSNLEISKDTVLQNIRDLLKWLDIKVYVLHDRAEIRGFMPTEVIDLPDTKDGLKRAAIIPSQILKGRGSGR